jgi:hypothetical protein
MDMTKMTVRVPRRLLERAKQYAGENDTTLTRLIVAYLEQIELEDDLLAEAPIVRRLSGSLSPDVSVGGYYRHLEEKYAIRNQGSD